MSRKKHQPQGLFSDGDIEGIVKGFISSWINGEIQVEFPEPSDFLDDVCNTQGKMEVRAQKYKDDFITLVNIITGHSSAEPVELQKAICAMYSQILTFRYNGMITGTFSKQEDYVSRINRLENETNTMNALIQELLIAYRSLAKR